MMNKQLTFRDVELFDSYRTWAETVEKVKTMLSKTAYQEKISRHGLECKQRMFEGKRFQGYKFSLSELEGLLQTATKNKELKLLLS